MKIACLTARGGSPDPPLALALSVVLVGTTGSIGALMRASVATPTPLLAELLEEPVGHLGVSVAGAVLSIFFYDQHSKVPELAGWFPAGGEHDAANLYALLDELTHPGFVFGDFYRRGTIRGFGYAHDG